MIAEQFEEEGTQTLPIPERIRYTQTKAGSNNTVEYKEMI
jgi:hypothetical protein